MEGYFQMFGTSLLLLYRISLHIKVFFYKITVQKESGNILLFEQESYGECIKF